MKANTLEPVFTLGVRSSGKGFLLNLLAGVGLIAGSQLVLVGESCAANVVTTVIRGFEDTKSFQYLHPEKTDEGYLAISVEVPPLKDRACITPTNSGGTDSYFVQKTLEIGIVAYVEGFAQINPKQGIPVASFEFDDSMGAYCLSPWVQPIVLVPNHQFGKRGPVGSPEPKVTLSMKYTSQGQEKVSSFLTAWLGIVSTVATGGASKTVVGLSNVMSNSAVSTIAQMYEQRTKGRSEENIRIDLPWNELAKGPSSRRVSIVGGEKGYFEPPEDAVARIRSSPKDQRPIFDVVLNFEFRRSLFVDDKDMNTTTWLPKYADTQLASSSILNYPKQTGALQQSFPNIVQAINSQAPSIAQD